MSPSPSPGPPTLPPGVEARRMDSGLEVLDVTPGDGSPAREGDVVTVHTRGWLLNGFPIEDTITSGEPVRFTVGHGQVVPGFEEGLLGLKPGGQRRLILPSDLAYGSDGKPPRIPPYATLIYDVELVEVREA